MTRRTLLLSLPLCLAGCSPPPPKTIAEWDAWGGKHRGISQGEVRRLLGPPASVVNGGNSWHYDCVNTSGNKTTAIVVFEGGVLAGVLTPSQ